MCNAISTAVKGEISSDLTTSSMFWVEELNGDVSNAAGHNRKSEIQDGGRKPEISIFPLLHMIATQIRCLFYVFEYQNASARYSDAKSESFSMFSSIRS
jgi:hypothetical protein